MDAPALRLGRLELASPVMLAPMCGVCDYPYLRLLRRLDSSSLVFHEMFSAVGLLNWDKRPDPRPMTVPEGLGPLGLQLFGHQPETMALAAEKLVAWGAAVVDLNLGCPVPRLTSASDGSALLREPALLGRILRAVVARLPGVPVTIKMRLGYSDDHQNYLEIARLAEGCGVAAITVHGRTRSQGYSGRADWDKIGEVAAAVRIPVVGNGDVTDPRQALSLLRAYGVAGVMVGRGAMGNPWLISRIAHLARTGELRPEPTFAQKLELGREHARLLVEELGEGKGLVEARRHLGWYTRGMPGSAALREAIHQTRALPELLALLEAHSEDLSAGSPA